VLQARTLTVEVGGRHVVEGATFTVSPRDKVGIVGRNGAGKTSLFKVLGGEAEPTQGSVVRKGGFGYLPQDPRIGGVHDSRRAITHVLSGREIDDQITRIEKLRIAIEE
jgi:ATPase subunit of ABC transporter with duplicated ATPase domains